MAGRLLKTLVGGALLSPAIMAGWKRWRNARDAGAGLSGGPPPTGSAHPAAPPMTGSAPQQGSAGGNHSQSEPATPTTPPTAGG